MAPTPQKYPPISVSQSSSCPENRNPNTSKYPTMWTSRPYLQSQSFSRSYGSILPTSLTHIVLSTRGCSPWRPAAVMSTAQPKRRLVRYRSLRFSRDNGYAPDVPKGGTLCRLFGPISDQFDSRVISFEEFLTAVKKKRELFLGHPLTFLSSLASPPRAWA